MKQNLLKKKKQQKQPVLKPQSQQKTQKLQQSKSPNLLQTVLNDSTHEKRHYRISKFSIILILLIQLLFMGLSIFNSSTIVKINNLQNEVTRLESTVLNLNSSEKLVRDVINKTEYLKTLETSRLRFAPTVKSFIESIPSNITLLKSFILGNTLTLTIEAETPLDISLLIFRYFEEGFASEIIIQSANLNTTSETFVATLEVIF